MASSKPPIIQAYKAGSAILTGQFLKFGADNIHVVPATLNDRTIGIAYSDQATVEGKVEVCMPGGGAKLKLGMAVVVAARLYSDSGALGKKCDGASKFIGAIAYDNGAQNDLIDVEVTVPHESVATD